MTGGTSILDEGWQWTHNVKGHGNFPAGSYSSLSLRPAINQDFDMFVFLIDQSTISILDHSVNFDGACYHLLWLQAAIIQSLYDSRKVLLEIPKDWSDR